MCAQQLIVDYLPSPSIPANVGMQDDAHHASVCSPDTSVFGSICKCVSVVTYAVCLVGETRQ